MLEGDSTFQHLALEEFAPLEVRRLLVGRYELRYEVGADKLSILRVFHAREDR